MTNFLDEHPQDWSNPQYKQLRDLLVNLVGNGNPGITKLINLAESTGLQTGSFPTGLSDVRTTCQELIKVMGGQGKLRILVEKAAAEPTAYKTEFTAMLDWPASPIPATPALGLDHDHYAVSWLIGDRVLVNREPLRQALAKLGNVHTGKHILVVQGEKEKSGKSHSFQLIRYLQERQGDFKVVRVDLARVARGSENGSVSPEELGLAIANQMGLEDVPERQEEKDERWVQRFCDWLTGEISEQDTIYWIVLDHFDKILLPGGTQFLIQELALRLEMNLNQLRLILLSFRDIDDLPADVFGGLEEDFTDDPIGGPELLEFFTKLYAERQTQKGIDFTAADVAGSVARVMQKVNFTDKKKYLRLLEKAVISEGKHIGANGGQS